MIDWKFYQPSQVNFVNSCIPRSTFATCSVISFLHFKSGAPLGLFGVPDCRARFSYRGLHIYPMQGR